MRSSPSSSPSSRNAEMADAVQWANNLVIEYQLAQARAAEEEKSLLDYARAEADAAEAGVILQVVAQEVQEQAHAKIAGMVTRCLESVFRRPYQFRIDFERKRGRTEARLVFEEGGHEVHPTFGASGGMREVASLALRIACLILTKPAPRKILFLDEPLKAVGSDEGNKARVAELLQTLSSELGIQIIMVTHDEEFAVGNVIRIGG